MSICFGWWVTKCHYEKEYGNALPNKESSLKDASKQKPLPEIVFIQEKGISSQVCLPIVADQANDRSRDFDND
jgi:hypothetical protein